MLSLFQNEVRKQTLQACLYYNPRIKHGSYVDVNIILFVRLNSLASTVVRYLVENEKRGGHYLRERTPIHMREWCRPLPRNYFGMIENLLRISFGKRRQ